MQTESATVIDFEAYRNRQKARQVDAGGGLMPAFPVAWVMVWFAPVFLVQPYAGIAAN